MVIRRTLFLFLTLVVATSWAQQPVSLSGRVLDASNNRPLPNVHVYFDNSTMGSSTNEQGEFFIKSVPTAHPPLVISAIGYRTVFIPTLDTSQGLPITLEVKLVPVSTILAPVTITAGKMKGNWARRYSDFRRILLGNTSNASKCEILNPEVISFRELDSLAGNNFSAHAIGPIEIMNHGLGYKLSVTLKEFVSLEKSYRMIFSTRFDSLKPSGERQRLRLQTSRVDTYKGSQRHFFKSLINGTYRQEGFRIIYTGDSLAIRRQPGKTNLDASNPGVTREAVLSDLVVDSSKTAPAILRKGVYQIHYANKVLALGKRNLPNEPSPVSWIQVEDPFLRLGPVGEIITPANFWRSGYMDDQRLADLLPYDYEVARDELTLVQQRIRESVVIRGTVADESGMPLPGVDVFVDRGLTGVTTNAWGTFEFPPLDPGKYPIAFGRAGSRDTLLVVDCTNEVPAIAMTLRQRDYRKQQPDPDREAHVKAFEYYLLKPTGAVWAFDLINPGVLQFEKKKDHTEVWATAPLQIESLTYGYEWKLFIRSGRITSKNMTLDALIDIDTIEALKPVEVRRWEKRRLDAYTGSWNQFVSSLQNGTAAADGFDIYQVRHSSKRRPRFAKLSPEDAKAVEGDSIFFASNGVLYLKPRPGLEIHNDNRRRGKKFYKGQSREVLRLSSSNPHVALTAQGITDPTELNISGARPAPLPLVPADLASPTRKKLGYETLMLLKKGALVKTKRYLEKAYVHTDRSIYNPGDSVWIKAYIRYSDPTVRDSLSRVLYADVLAAKTGKIVSTAVLRISDGQARGALGLDADLQPGDYYVRAYTSWMRNFDEIFSTPILLLAAGTSIEAQPSETVGSSPIEVSIASDKKQYGTTSPVRLDIKITSSGSGIAGTFSISVTDQSAVPEVTSGNIMELKRPFKAVDAQFLRITRLMERGITVKGSIPNAREGARYNVGMILRKENTYSFTTTDNGKFMLDLDFTDTTTAFVRATLAGTRWKTEIDDIPSPLVSSLPPPLSYKLITPTGVDRTILSPSDSARLLQEITVRAKRIVSPQHMFRTPTQDRFGFPHRVAEGPALDDVRNHGRLADFLLMAVPDFQNTLCVIQSQSQAEFGTRPDCAQPTRPVYAIYLDGLPVDPSVFGSLPTMLISRVEVYRFTAYAIAIYTEAKVPYRRVDYEEYLVRGYDPPVTFHVPDQKSGYPDYRPTIYWNPDVKADQNGQAVVTFRTSDVGGTYKVVVEGMTGEGEPVRGVGYLVVE
jgi:hypothetical protein